MDEASYNAAPYACAYSHGTSELSALNIHLMLTCHRCKARARPSSRNRYRARHRTRRKHLCAPRVGLRASTHRAQTTCQRDLRRQVVTIRQAPRDRLRRSHRAHLDARVLRVIRRPCVARPARTLGHCQVRCVGPGVRRRGTLYWWPGWRDMRMGPPCRGAVSQNTRRRWRRRG